VCRLNNPERSARILSAFGLVLLCGYLFSLTHSSLGVFFTPDDCMNLYRSWSFSPLLLVKSNLLFFLSSPFQRPMGSVFYAAIYQFAGFHSHPYHAVLLVLLAVNLFLTYFLARRLTGSRFAALLTALLCAYQQEFRPLYFDTGFIYDVLCYCFTIGALLYYVRVRQQKRSFGPRQIAILLLLFVCALNSKEMAIMLPAFLLSYEIIYRPPEAYSLHAITGWLRARCVLPLALCAVSLIFAAGRASGPDTLITNSAYRPIFSSQQFLLTSRQFLHDLLPLTNSLTPALILGLWVAAAILAIVSGSRALRFAWLWGIAAPLPIAFILPRGAPQYYVVLFAYALYAAALATLALQRLQTAIALRVPKWASQFGAAALFVLAVAMPYAHYRALGLKGLDGVTEGAPLVQSTAAEIHLLAPEIPNNSRILFLDDPAYPNTYDMLFIVRLSYNDITLLVDTIKRLNVTPSPALLTTYNFVFDYRAGRFRLARGTATDNNRKPEIFIASPRGGTDLAQAYHFADWKPVTQLNPAKPGERLILKTTGLGATDCPSCAGRPFPRNPLAHVVAAVNARVDGRLAEVAEKLGWPGEVDNYRVDVVLPRDTAPAAGFAAIEISENADWSVKTYIPVARSRSSTGFPSRPANRANRPLG